MKLNPRYDCDKLGWSMREFEDPDLGYEFDMIVFWKTTNGVFMAQDSGCSCPTPFEDYEGRDAVEIEQKLERIGTIEQGERAFDSWNKKSYGTNPHKLPQSSRNDLSAWLKANL